MKPDAHLCGTRPLDLAEKAGLILGDRTVRFTRRFFRALAYSTPGRAAAGPHAGTNLGPARWAISPSDGAHAARGTALTTQGRRIVRTAARGMSHHKIADQRSISPRTVASHLYKVFPRPGISSRRELDRALRELGDHT
ncbi:LuxR C-terminal-related transcriptional regulator [Streptomyces sp. NPDC051987]|uniref:LuxR C-terminal-related transcriptional regulator n=1 Tax=Streptomyces sp. NPDC051987 TaxID=3155808 RepID=UPI0034263466